MTPKQPISVAEFDKLYPDNTPQSPAQSASTPNQYGATFRATGEEGGFEAGLKAAGNVPSSAFNLGKNIVGAITSPIQTLKGVGNLVADLGATVTNKLTDVTGLGQKREQTTAKALGEAYFGEEGRYGSMNQALKTAIEDPFGVGSDILAVLQGGAGVLGKTAQLNSALSTTAKIGTAPIRSVFSGLSKGVVSGTKFGASQLTGLSPETISTITKNSKAFGEAQAGGVTRTDLAENVLDAVKKAGDELSDLGSGYDEIRAVQADVALPETWLQSSLDKYGIKLTQSGQPKIVNGFPDLKAPLEWKVSADKSSATRNVTDLNKIQEFIDNWGDSRTLTPDEYLNMRHDLAELAKYEVASGKSSVVQKFAQDVREGVLNADNVRGQVPGLKELDAKYSADKTFFKQIERDFINKETGGLKDGAASKVVNAVNAANPERLARLEKLYPGFTKQAKVIKAVEDVENAMGLKVGTYARAGVAASGILTGNAPVVIAAILSTPEIAVPLLKGYGITADKVGPILQAVSNAASDINNFRVPGAIEQYMKENYKDGVPVGMSIKKSVTPESVAKNMGPEDFNRLIDVIEDVFVAKNNPDTRRMLDNMGLVKATDEELVEFAKKATDAVDKLRAKAKVKPTTLLEEAKKYKSAEEFVKAQGTPVYHGTGAEFETFDPSKLGSKTGAMSAYEGFFFSPQRTLAENYRPLIERVPLSEWKNFQSTIVSSLKENGLPLTYETKDMGLYLPSAVGSPTTASGLNYMPATEMRTNLRKAVDRLMSTNPPPKQADELARAVAIMEERIGTINSKNFPTKRVGDVKEAYLEMKNPFIIDHGGARDGRSFVDEIKKAKQNGHDSVIIKNTEDPLPGDVHIVFDVSQIKTRTQLTDIWKQANETKP